MTGVPLICCSLLGLGIALLAIPMVLRSRWASSGERSFDPHHTHTGHVPRLGGLVLVVAFLCLEVVIRLCFPSAMTRLPGREVILVGSVAMFLLGFVDDLRPLGARRKLLGQVLIAVTVCYGGIGIERLTIPFTGTSMQLGLLSLPVTVLWLVGITNLINLIDGADGLAGGICLMLLLLLAYVGYQSGTFALLAAGMAGAVLGFLWFNFPPARIYLGDGGAYFLGFLIAMLSLANSHKGTVFGALIAPLFVLALPILDTTLAILRRGLRGLPLFRPDRRHIHHHMLGAGMSRRKMVLSLYSLTLVFLVMGFAAFLSNGRLAPVMLGLGVLVVLLCAGQLSFSREWLAVGRTVGNSLAMRQEIQYALCLSRWLVHEADRCGSVEELYQDLVFAARRLGFSRLKLTLADGQRAWEQPGANHALHARLELQGGRYGVIELSAPACIRDQGCPRDRSSIRSCPCLSNSNLFEILAELVAESWSSAVRKWDTAARPLRFDQPVPAGRQPPPRKGAQLALGRGFSQPLSGNANAITD